MSLSKKRFKITNCIFFILYFFLIVFLCNFAYAENTVKAKVYTIAVIDGDTILVNYKNGKKKVRLLGIQATEITTIPPEPYSQESKDLLKSIIEKQYVTLEYQKTKYLDKYHRILGNIYFNSLWINQYLISKGLAFVYIINGNNIPKIAELIKTEDQAINNKLGLWRLRDYQVITADQAKNYINKYKIIDGFIENIKITHNSIWLFLEKNGNKGFAIRLENNSNNQNIIQNTTHKKIRARGYIDRYNYKYGPIINVKNIRQIEFLD